MVTRKIAVKARTTRSIEVNSNVTLNLLGLKCDIAHSWSYISEVLQSGNIVKSFGGDPYGLIA